MDFLGGIYLPFSLSSILHILFMALFFVIFFYIFWWNRSYTDFYFLWFLSQGTKKYAVLNTHVPLRTRIYKNKSILYKFSYNITVNENYIQAKNNKEDTLVILCLHMELRVLVTCCLWLDVQLIGTSRETERGGPCRPIETEVNRDSGSTYGRVSFLGYVPPQD